MLFDGMIIYPIDLKCCLIDRCKSSNITITFDSLSENLALSTGCQLT